MSEQILTRASHQQWEGLKHRLLGLLKSRRELRETLPSDPQWEYKHSEARRWSGAFYDYKGKLIKELSE